VLKVPQHDDHLAQEADDVTAVCAMLLYRYISES